MRYSIRGELSVEDSDPIIAVINNYTLWRPNAVDEREHDMLTFEVWVNTETDKTALFNDLKPFVDQHSGLIDWHKCTHDEEVSHPCVIVEEYRGE